MKPPPRTCAALLLPLLLPTGLSAQETKASRRPPLSDAERFLVDHVRPDVASGHLRQLTRSPHRAGSTADRRTAEYVASVLAAAGFRTHLEEYHVLLPAAVSWSPPSAANRRRPVSFVNSPS